MTRRITRLMFNVCACSLLLLATQITNAKTITPTDAFQQSQEVVALISSIHTYKGLNTLLPKIPIPKEKIPTQVYFKSLEVLRKIALFQKELGLTQVAVPALPNKELEPQDVYNNLQVMVTALQAIRHKVGVPGKVEIPVNTGEKQPADVYRNLAKADMLLEDIVGYTTPSLVYRNTQYILADIKAIAEKYSIKFTSPNVIRPVIALPKHANRQAVRLLDSVIKLQKELGLNPSSVSVVKDATASSDVLDVTQNVLARLARVKAKLNVMRPKQEIAEDKYMQPADVMVQLTTANIFIEQLLSEKNIKKLQ